MKSIAVIPAFNEEKHISDVVKKTKKYVDKVVVIDDGSSDKTADLAKKSGAVVLKHEINKGLGGALKTGIEYSRKHGFDMTITIDGDGQHNSKDIPLFTKKIKQGYDFVLGQRNVSKYPLHKKIGNFFLCLLTNIISGTDIVDTESGFRAFSKKAVNKIKLIGTRYEIAAEIIYQVGKNNLKSTNVKLSESMYHRKKGVGIKDGIKNFNFLLRRRKKNFLLYTKDLLIVLKKTLRNSIKWIFH